jgi:hypothetical protein
MSRFKYHLQHQVSPTVAPLSAAIGLALGATTLQAATITVTSLDDGSVPGQCTLRDALASANGNVATAGCAAGLGADDIVFAPGLTGTINLTEGYLIVDSELSLTGPGPASLTISGDGSDRLMGVSSVPAQISGLRFENGYVNDVFGGAALAFLGSTASLSDCEIANNASGPASNGGAITAIGANLTIDQCTVSGNSVAGGIILRGSIDAFGGDLLAVNSDITITSSSFLNNSADNYGGALALFESNATVSASTFTGNNALIGGAISLGESTLVMNDSFITENSAYGGGGLAVGSQSYVTLTTSEIYGNSAVEVGGGALVGVGYAPPVPLPEPNGSEGPLGGGGSGPSLTGPGAMLIEDSYIAFNSSNGTGGGLAAKYDSTVQADGADIAYNETVPAIGPLAVNAPGRGGGGPPPELRGGGVAALDGAYIELVASNLRSNVSEFGGGGFAGLGGLRIENSLVTSNQAELGGGLLAGTDVSTVVPLQDPATRGGPPSNSGAVEIYGSLIAGNNGTFGGGVASAYGGFAFIGDSNVLENTAPGWGGGLLVYDGTMVVGASLIADNQAYEGGGVWAEGGDGTILISQSTVRDNAAQLVGGLNLRTDFTRLKYSTIANNEAATVGGVFMQGPPGANNLILNSTITGNSAEILGGLYASEATLNFLTVSHNQSLGGGPTPPEGIFDRGGLSENPGGASLSGNVEVGNSLFSDNLSPGGGTIDLSIEAPGTLTVDYSLIETPGLGVGGGIGNLFNVDPQLGPLALNGGPTATRAIGPGSPALDAADPATTVINDQRADPYPRVFNGRADIGAFEFFIDAIFSDRFEQP